MRITVHCECARLDCDKTFAIPLSFYLMIEGEEGMFVVAPDHVEPLVDGGIGPLIASWHFTTVISSSPADRKPLDIAALRQQHDAQVAAAERAQRDFDAHLARLQASGPAAALALGLFVAVRPDTAAEWTFVLYAAAAVLVLAVLILSVIGVRSARENLDALLHPMSHMPIDDVYRYLDELKKNPVRRAAEQPVTGLSIRQLEHIREAQNQLGGAWLSVLTEEEWLLYDTGEQGAVAGRTRTAANVARTTEKVIYPILLTAVVLVVADAVAAFITS